LTVLFGPEKSTSSVELQGWTINQTVVFCPGARVPLLAGMKTTRSTEQAGAVFTLHLMPLLAFAGRESVT